MINVKKVLSGVILTILSALIFTSCAEKTEKPQEEKPEVLAPSQIVPIAQAKDMYNDYTNRRVPLIQNYEDSINGGEKKFDVARYVSYDYATIKQYLAFIEQEAQKANVEISGLRFYFSNYPDKARFNNGDSIVHPRQNSIMLSPTLKKGDRDYIFYIGGTEQQEQAILLSDSFGELGAKGLGDNAKATSKAYASSLPSLNTFNTTTNAPLYDGGSVTMNRGGSAPPPYN